MNGEIIIDDTQLARDYCATLDAGVQYYTNLVTELRSARDKISANWEGDAAAIYDVISRIDQITSTIDASIVPVMVTLLFSLPSRPALSESSGPSSMPVAPQIPILMFSRVMMLERVLMPVE